MILNSRTNQPIPWRAVVVDRKVDAGVLYLEIDGRVLRFGTNDMTRLPSGVR